MKEIELFTIDSLNGFEGNHAEDILHEANELSDITLNELYITTRNALQICASENNYPETIMEHYNAICITLMQEITKRTTEK